MRNLFLLFVMTLGYFSNAQVKEVNFLGKNWYLHGYDFRIGNSIHSQAYDNKLPSLVSFPSENYRASTLENTEINDWGFDGPSLFTVGFVLRPFYLSDKVWKRHIEVAHDVELKRRNIAYFDQTPNPNFDYDYRDYRLKTSHLGYSPKITYSSPSFLRRFKAYASLYSSLRLPLNGYLYTNPDAKVADPNARSNYFTIHGTSYSDRIAAEYFEMCGGAQVGIKMNIHCKWNIHLERNMHTLHSFSKDFTQSNSGSSQGFRFGIRYMYGTPPTQDAKTLDDDNPVFW